MPNHTTTPVYFTFQNKTLCNYFTYRGLENQAPLRYHRAKGIFYFIAIIIARNAADIKILEQFKAPRLGMLPYLLRRLNLGKEQHNSYLQLRTMFGRIIAVSR
jgi:hypothetical protein